MKKETYDIKMKEYNKITKGVLNGSYLDEAEDAEHSDPIN